MKRYAIVRNANSRREAAAYLPENYQIIHETEDDRVLLRPGTPRPLFVIAGEDRYGWSLDSYVIPRFASGLIAVEEIDLSHPLMKKVPA